MHWGQCTSLMSFAQWPHSYISTRLHSGHRVLILLKGALQPYPVKGGFVIPLSRYRPYEGQISLHTTAKVMICYQENSAPIRSHGPLWKSLGILTEKRPSVVCIGKRISVDNVCAIVQKTSQSKALDSKKYMFVSNSLNGSNPVIKVYARRISAASWHALLCRVPWRPMIGWGA